VQHNDDMTGKFLQRSGHETTYYFRRRVPADVRQAMRLTQVYRTLRTTDRRAAVMRARVPAVRRTNFSRRFGSWSTSAIVNLSNRGGRLILGAAEFTAVYGLNQPPAQVRRQAGVRIGVSVLEWRAGVQLPAKGRTDKFYVNLAISFDNLQVLRNNIIALIWYLHPVYCQL